MTRATALDTNSAIVDIVKAKLLQWWKEVGDEEEFEEFTLPVAYFTAE